MSGYMDYKVSVDLNEHGVIRLSNAMGRVDLWFNDNNELQWRLDVTKKSEGLTYHDMCVLNELLERVESAMRLTHGRDGIRHINVLFYRL